MLRRTLSTLVALLIFVPFMSVASATDVSWDSRRSGDIPVGVLQPVQSAPEAGGQVFGHPVFYYDPFYWSYPWGPYGYNYYYDYRPQVRVKVEPEEIGDDAAVYVDGHYAGVVDDFDGSAQGKIVEEGAHTITVFTEGYRTARFNIHVGEGEVFTVRHTLVPLAPGERSESPELDRPETASTSPTRRMRRY